MARSELDNFHDKTMDGLLFCRKAYLLFNKIRRQTNGKERLRMRQSSVEKKLIEEILPISRYIQIRYCEARAIKIRWLNGNQQYDAILKQTGSLVEYIKLPKECFLEVTCAVHSNDYLLREAINNRTPVFGFDGLKRDKKSREVLSTPVGRKYPEYINNFARIIIDRIKDKAEKSYPNNTILIVDCSLNTAYLEDEWNELVKNIRDGMLSHKFIELFLYDRILQQHAFV